MTATRGPTTSPAPLRRTAAGRALAVLDAFGPGSRTLTLSEIARRAGLTLPTTHRLVGELVSWGALERHPSGRYFLGLRLLELAALAPRGLELREAAYPYLDDLHQATRANVHLGVRDGCEVVYVETMRSRVSAQISSRVGDRWPLHATGTGLVLLAYADKELQDTVLQAPLVRFSPKTIVARESCAGCSPTCGRPGWSSLVSRSAWKRWRWPCRCAGYTTRWWRRSAWWSA